MINNRVLIDYKFKSTYAGFMISRNISTIFLPISILFLLSSLAKTQSLDELLRTAREENLELKALKNEYLAALERAPQVSQMPDPEVGIGAFPLPVETRLGAQVVRLSATQMFPWFGTLESKADLENAKAQALFERIAARALHLIFEIRQAYYRLYEIQKSQEVIRRNIDILDALERLALMKVESGKASAADVLRVQLKVEELKQEVEILESASRVPAATINQILNRHLESPVEVVDSLAFASLLFRKDSLRAELETNHPMLRMFTLQQDISHKALKMNQLIGKPSFGAGLDYIMVNARNDAIPMRNGRDIVQIKAAVRIPLNRKKYEAKEREEDFKISALEYKKEDALNTFMAAIEKAFVDYEAARLKLELYEKQTLLTRAAVRILETEYSVKGSNFDELLRLEKDLVDYEMKILKAIVQSHLAKSNIERFIAKDKK